MNKRIEELEKQSADENLWNDPEAAQKTLGELSDKKRTLGEMEALTDCVEDLRVLYELTAEEDSGWDELEAETGRVEVELQRLSVIALLSGEFDEHDAIMEIKPGAGGIDAADFAAMLLRMYTRYFDETGYKCDIIYREPFEEAGIRSATLIASGFYAYGRLSAEAGVHRLVRVSPFDKKAQRHTGFVNVSVWPKIEEDEGEIVISESDLKIDTFRSSGPGGQHANVTDSAVRITHKPSGIVVTCQSERSQHINKAQALTVLRSRLAERKRREQEEKLEKMKGEKRDIAFGSQIRSYVQHPYQMVKDHRTDFETSNVEAVLNGDLDGLIDSELKRRGRR
ncbi:MAG: peptide chain release factor 2 [bacterium]|nr:peptide chain release factor 2 [bacterium]